MGILLEAVVSMGPLRSYITWPTDEKPSISIRDKPIFSSDRMLHKDYYRKSSVEKKSLVVGLKGPGAKANSLAVNRQS
jgi:hypothetical protein